jgi:hypothetical protein
MDPLLKAVIRDVLFANLRKDRINARRECAVVLFGFLCLDCKENIFYHLL